MRSTELWGIDLTMPQSLVLALHLRDAAGLRPPTSPVLPDLPPLDPPVTHLGAAGDGLAGLEVAGGQWARWWGGAFPGGAQALTSILPPRYSGLAGMPELRGLAELGMDEAITWSGRVREAERRVLKSTPSALFETNLVAEVERELGRRIRPFELRIVVLPVQGARHWDVLGRPVISLALRADRDAYLVWLRERLIAMARPRLGTVESSDQT